MEMTLAQVEMVDMLMKLWPAMSDGSFFIYFGFTSWTLYYCELNNFTLVLQALPLFCRLHIFVGFTFVL